MPMTESFTLDRNQFSNLLDLLGAPAHLEVIAERQDLLRFGQSRVTYQHSEDRLTLRTKLMRDGRAAWGTIGTLDPASIATLRGRLEAFMAHLPVSEEEEILLAPGSNRRTAATFFPSTANASAEERVAWFARAVESLPPGATLGGSIVHSVVHHAVGNSTGLYQCESRTRVMVQAVGTQENRSAYAWRIHRDANALDGAQALDSVCEKLSPLPVRALAPGTYRAVLAPTALITCLATFGHIALNAAAYAAGTSAVSGRLGQQVVSPLLTCVDDGCDEAGLPTTFDCEGAPKQRVSLIEGGILAGVVHNAHTAHLQGTSSTGHAVPPGWRFGAGPSPSHLVLAPGNASETELIAECGTGLYIQRVNYVRVVHPKQTLVTGTTRDATLWIENGKIAARLPQFRFTFKLIDLLSAIVGLGKVRERGEAVFMESIAAPAALVSAFPVDAVTQ